MTKLYASLTGPLLGVYYPLPNADETTCRLLLNESQLKSLWCGIYNENQVDEQIEEYGGVKLPDNFCVALVFNGFVAETKGAK